MARSVDTSTRSKGSVGPSPHHLDMANPEMWKVATRTDCDFIACGGPLLPEELYDDPDDAAQAAAGEEDQSPPDWEGA